MLIYLILNCIRIFQAVQVLNAHEIDEISILERAGRILKTPYTYNLYMEWERDNSYNAIGSHMFVQSNISIIARLGYVCCKGFKVNYVMKTLEPFGELGFRPKPKTLIMRKDCADMILIRKRKFAQIED